MIVFQMGQDDTIYLHFYCQTMKKLQFGGTINKLHNYLLRKKYLHITNSDSNYTGKSNDKYYDYSKYR